MSASTVKIDILYRHLWFLDNVVFWLSLLQHHEAQNYVSEYFKIEVGWIALKSWDNDGQNIML